MINLNFISPIKIQQQNLLFVVVTSIVSHNLNKELGSALEMMVT